MKKRGVVLAFLTMPLLLAAGQEMSVEESYLQESVENMIIREQSRSDTREMKMLALAYIEDAIGHGNTSADVHAALEYLGLEGIVNRTRENGRLVNNFPDVRREAAKYLGRMGTPEAKATLIRMIYVDNEPMVIQEAIKSLADANAGDDPNAISTIAWVLQRFDNTNPDNLLALAAIDAFDKFGASSGIKDPNAIQMLMRIADGPYIRPVQEKAKAVLTKFRKQSAR